MPWKYEGCHSVFPDGCQRRVRTADQLLCSAICCLRAGMYTPRKARDGRKREIIATAGEGGFHGLRLWESASRPDPFSPSLFERSSASVTPDRRSYGGSDFAQSLKPSTVTVWHPSEQTSVSFISESVWRNMCLSHRWGTPIMKCHFCAFGSSVHEGIASTVVA